jgi:hypothetical protein
MTTLELGTGLLTGSLGWSARIQSSGDVVAAAVTVFAVRLAGRPADGRHPYGYRRVERLILENAGPDLRVTAGRIMGIESGHRMLARGRRPGRGGAGRWSDRDGDRHPGEGRGRRPAQQQRVRPDAAVDDDPRCARRLAERTGLSLAPLRGFVDGSGSGALSVVRESRREGRGREGVIEVKSRTR